ncbi:MAG: HEAT repeat domain-containing protein [Planctomycetota bacterium]
MRPIYTLLLLIVPMASAFAEPADVTLDEHVPNDVVAIQALIGHFGDPGFIVRTEPWLQVTPKFVAYAEAVAKLDGCVPLLAELLVVPEVPDSDIGVQVRVAAAIALEAVGPDAIQANVVIRDMLRINSHRDNILACGIIRGIGPGAIDLLPELRTLLHSDNFHVQYWACRAIAAIGPDAHLAATDLCLALDDGAASVRRNAAIALGEIGPGATLLMQAYIVEELMEALDDYSHPVRVEVEAALQKMYEIDLDTQIEELIEEVGK